MLLSSLSAYTIASKKSLSVIHDVAVSLKTISFKGRFNKIYFSMQESCGQGWLLFLFSSRSSRKWSVMIVVFVYSSILQTACIWQLVDRVRRLAAYRMLLVNLYHNAFPSVRYLLFSVDQHRGLVQVNTPESIQDNIFYSPFEFLWFFKENFKIVSLDFVPNVL